MTATPPHPPKNGLQNPAAPPHSWTQVHGADFQRCPCRECSVHHFDIFTHIRVRARRRPPLDHQTHHLTPVFATPSGTPGGPVPAAQRAGIRNLRTGPTRSPTAAVSQGRQDRLPPGKKRAWRPSPPGTSRRQPPPAVSPGSTPPGHPHRSSTPVSRITSRITSSPRFPPSMAFSSPSASCTIRS